MRQNTGMGKKIHIMCPHVIKEPTMLAIWNGIRGWTGSFTWGDGRVADCELLLLKGGDYVGRMNLYNLIFRMVFLFYGI
jgi:hypothetical protein